MEILEGWVYPVRIIYTSDPKVWSKEVKKHKWYMKDGSPLDWPAGACAIEGYSEEGGSTIAVLLNREHFSKKDKIGPVALLVHEITHVKQYIQNIIKEKEFSSESEAYLMQFLTEWFLTQYMDGK